MSKKINLRTFKAFFNSNSVGGFLLFVCVALSLMVANSSLGADFEVFLESYWGYESEWLKLNFSILHWINDGLMAVFFLLVGLEIKREIVEGELSSPKKAALPIIAAFGGAILPAAIFFLFNKGTPEAAGWGIPMATDIAFALAVISLLGKRVPASLKIFLAALAIVDDLIAILVIAIFYSSDLQMHYLMYAGGLLLLLIGFNKFGLKNIWWYIIPGLFVWYFVHHSGIHATIAGVLVAMTLPTTPDAKQSPLEKLEHALTKPVNIIIIPIFALANTNIKLQADMMDGLFSSLGLGIILGLLVGKAVGVLTATWLGVKCKVGDLPQGAGWKHMLGLGLLAGIGFTMSIFISLLSFSDEHTIAQAKFAVLVGSMVCGIVGYVFLAKAGNTINRPLKRR